MSKITICEGEILYTSKNDTIIHAFDGNITTHAQQKNIWKGEQGTLVGEYKEMEIPKREDFFPPSKCYCNRDFTDEEFKNIIIELRKKEIVYENGKPVKNTIKDGNGNPILKDGKKQFKERSQYEELGEKLFYLNNTEKINTNEANFLSFTKAINNTFKKYEINTCIRKIHFLAQCYHETQRFGLTYEKDNSYMKNYKGGSKFRGRGLIQLTHDYSYTDYYNYLNKTKFKVSDVDFYNRKLIPFTKKISTEIAYACDSSGWNWLLGGVPTVGKNINLLADEDDVLKVSRAINGNVKSPFGLNERKLFTKLLKEIMDYEQNH